MSNPSGKNPFENEAFTGETFKGWVKPGPAPAGGPPPEPGETLDPLSGRWGIYQYEKGHRYSTDDLLTAWYATAWCPSPQRVLDLGSGISSIALMTAWKVPGAHFTTIEAQEQSFKLAQKSVAYNGVQNRFRMYHGDLRHDILAEDKKFDLVMACPPYWPVGHRTPAQHSQAAPARLEVRGDISDYCRITRRHLGAGALFVVTFPFDQMARVKKSAEQNDLGIIRYRPVHFKEGKPESLGLFAMVKKSDVPDYLWLKPWMEPPLVIRLANGQSHPEYMAIKLSMGFPPW